jgi:hypothetical protein
MGMVLTFLGIVLWATLFDTILAQFDILMGYAHLSSFTLLQTMLVWMDRVASRQFWNTKRTKKKYPAHTKEQIIRKWRLLPQ